MNPHRSIPSPAKPLMVSSSSIHITLINKKNLDIESKSYKRYICLMREVISPEIRLDGCLDIFQLTVSSLKIHMLNLVIVGGEACLVTLVGGGTMNAKGLSPYSIWGVSKLQLSRDYAPPPLSLYSPSL